MVRDTMVPGDHEGTRPWAWWEYESAEARDNDVPEHHQLLLLGVLTEYEVNVLRKWASLSWRHAFPGELTNEQKVQALKEHASFLESFPRATRVEPEQWERTKERCLRELASYFATQPEEVAAMLAAVEW